MIIVGPIANKNVPSNGAISCHEFYFFFTLCITLQSEFPILEDHSRSRSISAVPSISNSLW